MNQDSILSVRRALQEGWQGTIRNLWFLIGVVVIFYVLSLIPGLVDLLVPDEREDGFFWVIFLVISCGRWLLQAIMSMGSIKITLRILDGQPVEYRYLFSEYHQLLTFVAASFLYGVIVMIGFLLFIIPGIYWALKYQFFAYRIVDAGDGVFDALRKSGEITSGVKLPLLGLSLLNMAIVLLGTLLLGVGLLVAVPVTMIATASAYRQLTARVTTAPPPAAPIPAATPGAA